MARRVVLEATEDHHHLREVMGKARRREDMGDRRMGMEDPAGHHSNIKAVTVGRATGRRPRDSSMDRPINRAMGRKGRDGNNVISVAGLARLK